MCDNLVFLVLLTEGVCVLKYTAIKPYCEQQFMFMYAQNI